jgi:hypothetical protein
VRLERYGNLPTMHARTDRITTGSAAERSMTIPWMQSMLLLNAKSWRQDETFD